MSAPIPRHELGAQLSEQAVHMAGSETTVTCGTTEVVVIPRDGNIECEAGSSTGSRGRVVVVVGPDGQPAIIELREE
jgi:hypothetical protein